MTNDDAWRGSFVVTPARLAALFLLTVLVSDSSAAMAPDETVRQLFREKIQPVLEANCFECHSASATKIKGGLRLDSREASRRGGGDRPGGRARRFTKELADPGHPARRRSANAAEKAETERRGDRGFREMGAMGAPDPREAETTPPSRMISKRHGSSGRFSRLRTNPPTVKDKGWVKSPLDRFVLAKLEEQGLRPAPPASKADLVRGGCISI